MTGRYATPAAFKQALEHRLRERAAGSGTELARRRQLLVFDRFLVRIATTFGDRAILKGALVIELRLGRARTMKDVDLRLLARPEDPLERLRDAGRRDLCDFLAFEIAEAPRHPEIEAEGMRYQGRRFRVRALLAGKVYGAPFGVDVAFAEPLVGEVETIEGDDVLAFAGVETATFQIYPVETHIAEKLHAYTMPPTRIPDPPGAWTPVYERLARTDGLPWTTIEELAAAVRAFLDPVLAGESGSWSPAEWRWTEENGS